MIEISKPSLGYAEQEAVNLVMAAGWIAQGPKVAEFEEACREMIGCKYFIAVSSCTKAIELSLILSGCRQGDQVIVPSLTYASVIHVIINLGLVPVFADVAPDTLSVSISDLEQKIGPQVKYIIPVHLRGVVCNLDTINRLASAANIKVIEDAAHAFGSTWNGKPVGNGSYAACFSFGPLKNISCIEGGGIATNSAELAAALVRYRNLGASSSTWQRFEYNAPPTARDPGLVITGAGDKCQMTDVHAAVGLVQFSRMNEIRAKRNTLLNRYRDALSDLERVTFPEFDTDRDFIYICVIMLKDDSREALMEHLLAQQIRTTLHYKPNHRQPYFARYANADLPGTESVTDRILTLPCYTDLSFEEQDLVISAIRNFYGAAPQPFSGS